MTGLGRMEVWGSGGILAVRFGGILESRWRCSGYCLLRSCGRAKPWILSEFYTRVPGMDLHKCRLLSKARSHHLHFTTCDGNTTKDHYLNSCFRFTVFKYLYYLSCSIARHKKMLFLQKIADLMYWLSLNIIRTSGKVTKECNLSGFVMFHFDEHELSLNKWQLSYPFCLY